MILIYDATSGSAEHIATVEDGEQTYGEDAFDVDIMEEDAMLHRYNGPYIIATKVDDEDLQGIGKQAASIGLTLDDWQRSPTPETENRWYSPSRDEYRYQKTEPGSGGKSEYEKMREREARRESDIADMPVKERLQNAFSLASDTQTAREAGITAGASVAEDMSVLSYPDGSRDFAVPVSAHNTYVTRQLTQENQARANNEVGPELTELFGGKSCEVEIVYHNGEDHIVKEGIDGTMLTDVMLEARDEGKDVDPDILNSVMDLMAATWLTGNRDVHGSNIIINDNNEAVLIDHDSGPYSENIDPLMGNKYARYAGQKAISFIEVQTRGEVGSDPFIKRGLEVAVRVAEGEIPLPDTLGPQEKKDVRERAMTLIRAKKRWPEFEDYIPDRFLKALQAKQWVPHYNRDNVQVGWKDANNPSDIRYQENMPGSAEATEDASEAANATDEAGLTDADYEAATDWPVDGEKLYEVLVKGGDTERLAEGFVNSIGDDRLPGDHPAVARKTRRELKNIHEQLTLRYVREEYPITVEIDGEEVEMGVSLGSMTDYLLERMDIRYKSTATRGPLANKEDKMFRKVEGELGKLTSGARGMGKEMMKMTNSLAESVNPAAASLYDSFSDMDIELYEELEDIRKDSVSVLRQVFGDTITLYRGETGNFGNEFDEQPEDEKVGEHKPLESWSASPSCAAGFAGDGGYMLKKEIPVEKTMFPWFLGVGFGTEVEVGVAMSERESFEVGEEIFRTPSQDDEEPPNMPEYSTLDVAKDEFAQMQKLAQNMERIKQENEEEDTEGRQLAIARTLDWEGYRTDTGEQAWYNTVTGERRYQETKPGTQGDGEDEEVQQVEQLPPAESLEQRLDLIDVEEQLIEGAVVTTEDGTKVTVTGATDNFGHIYGKAMQAGDYVNMVVDADDIASVVPSPESSIIQGDIDTIAEDNELEVFESSPNMFQASINAGFDEPFPDAVTYMDRVAFELDDGAYLIGDVIEKNGHKGSQDPIVRVRTQSGNIRDMNLGDAVGINSRYEGYDSIADVPTQERLQNPFDFAVERGSLRDYGIMKGGQTGHAMEIITYEDGSRDFLTPLSAMGGGRKAERRAQRNVVQARLGNSIMPGAFAKTERATDADTGEEFIVKEGVEKRKGGPKRSTYGLAPPEIGRPVAAGCLLGNGDLHINNVIVTEGATYGESVIIDHDFFGDDLMVAFSSAGWASPENYIGQVAVDAYNNRDNIDAEGITDDDKEQINQNFKESLYRAAREAKDGNLRNYPAELMRLYEEADGRSEGIAAMPDVIP